jgi:Icc-related predicted phosphoesterase
MIARIGVIGDIHEAWNRLERVASHSELDEVDALLLVGDFVASGLSNATTEARRTEECIERTLGYLAHLECPVVFVPGNHDDPNFSHPCNVDRRVSVVSGLRVAGIGGSGPAVFGFPYEWSENEIREVRLPDHDLLLTHAPPAGTSLDLVRGVHVGSQAIRERASALRGVLICGHIHESPGYCRLGDCACVNVGSLGEPLGSAQFAVIEIEMDTRVVRCSLHRLELGQVTCFESPPGR